MLLSGIMIVVTEPRGEFSGDELEKDPVRSAAKKVTDTTGK